MPWIKTVSVDEAKGFLAKQYELALKRAGRIWGIVSAMSLNPRALKTSMDLYSALMHGRSPLGRSQREMLAVVVSAKNHCLY